MAKDRRDPPEDVPRVLVLEAMQDQERKDTETLIEGFDRPGRPTRRARPPRDFVDYYSNKEVPSGEDASTRRPATVVRSRSDRVRAALTWAAAAATMIVFGIVIALLATPDAESSRPHPAITPSAATTITSAATSPAQIANDEAEESTGETTAPTVIVGASPPPSAHPAKPPAYVPSSRPGKATSRDDFMRDL